MSARVQVIAVPYHFGVHDVSLGRGPAPVARAVEAAVGDRPVALTTIELPPLNGADHELARCLALEREVSIAVRSARAEGALAVVLAGNDHTAVGTVAGLALADLAVLWIDAHPDAHTADTTKSGYFDGSTLARLLGRSHLELTRSLAGFAPVSPASMLLAGIRDVDPGEADLLAQTGIAVVRPGRGFADDVESALAALAVRARALYVHLDADVLDAGTACVSRYAIDGGPSVEELCAVVSAARDRFDIAAINVVGYDPGYDRAGNAPPILAALVAAGAGAVDAPSA